MARILSIGNKVISKNLYYKTFLAIFDLLLKRDHVNFYLIDCITKLKHESFITYVNYCKNCLHFFQQSIRMNGKRKTKKSTKVTFIKTKPINIHDIGIDKILVPKKNNMVQKIHLNILLDIMMI